MKTANCTNCGNAYAMEELKIYGDRLICDNCIDILCTSPIGMPTPPRDKCERCGEEHNTLELTVYGSRLLCRDCINDLCLNDYKVKFSELLLKFQSKIDDCTRTINALQDAVGKDIFNVAYTYRWERYGLWEARDILEKLLEESDGM